MKYSYSWIKELSGTKFTPEKAADLLTMHSFELEHIEKLRPEIKDVVVGKILEIKKHPNADRLQITKVDIGTKNKLSIICGAWNIKVGDKVPVALAGAKLPNGLKIKKAKIREVESVGMLCAEDELGLGIDHSGILILDNKTKIGMPVGNYLKMPNDTVFEIKILPDRAHDAMSHVGVARELAILSNQKMEYDFDGLKLPKKNTSAKHMLSVQIKDKNLCSRYIGVVLENIEIKDSPDWMKKRLSVSGIQSINNVVDATNYVMLEIGQPLHAFDMEKIKNQKSEANLVVRRAMDKEKLTLLDGSQIKLNNSNLLITNGKTPLALAGIMGGKNSGISKETKTIIIEAASFNAINIRRTRTHLELRTESSDRFEKGLDPNLCEKAMTRVIEILEHIANAKIKKIVDIYPKKIKPWKIKLNLIYANNLLGEIITKKEVMRILTLLGIKTKTYHSQANITECTIPTFRVDLKTQEDLIEEIGRIWGYENIKPKALVEPIIPAPKNKMLSLEKTIREKMIGLGFDEIYNYSFYSQADANMCGLEKIKHLKLTNPMNPEQEMVRVSLAPNILRNARQNLKHFEEFNIFEIGRTYQPNKNKIIEKRKLIMAKVIERDNKAHTFYNLKGAIEDLLDSFDVSEISTPAVKIQIPKIAHSGRVAKIKVNGDYFGVIYEVNPLVLAKYKIKKRVAIAEFDLEKFMAIIQKEKLYQPIQKYPTIKRDISMITESSQTVAGITNFIQKIVGRLALNVEMFDVFQKGDKTSLAFHIEFGTNKRTLKKTEVDALMKKIIFKLEKELKVKIRK